MKIITPGLAEALTPRDWTASQLDRRERAARPHPARLPHLTVRQVTLHVPLPTLVVPRHRAP